MKSTQNFDHMIELARRQGLVVFVGSGISQASPSDLPTGGKFRDEVITALCRSSDVPEVLNRIELSLPDLSVSGSQIPFESLLLSLELPPEILFDVIYTCVPNHLSEIIAVFTGTEPNVNHKILAYGLKHGIVHELITTNFDTLLEDACERINMRRGKNFKVIIGDQDAFENMLMVSTTPLIWKIHGSVGYDKNAILSLYHETHEVLFNYQFYQNLGGLVDKQPILFIGYSCNDLDLFPLLCGVTPSSKFWIVRKEGEEDFRASVLGAQMIYGDLNSILIEFADKLELLPKSESKSIEVNQKLRQSLNFADKITRWVGKLALVDRLMIINMLLAISGLSILYVHLLVEAARCLGDTERRQFLKNYYGKYNIAQLISTEGKGPPSEQEYYDTLYNLLRDNTSAFELETDITLSGAKNYHACLEKYLEQLSGAKPYESNKGGVLTHYPVAHPALPARNIVSLFIALAFHHLKEDQSRAESTLIDACWYAIKTGESENITACLRALEWFCQVTREQKH